MEIAYLRDLWNSFPKFVSIREVKEETENAKITESVFTEYIEKRNNDTRCEIAEQVEEKECSCSKSEKRFPEHVTESEYTEYKDQRDKLVSLNQNGNWNGLILVNEINDYIRFCVAYNVYEGETERESIPAGFGYFPQTRVVVTQILPSNICKFTHYQKFKYVLNAIRNSPIYQ